LLPKKKHFLLFFYTSKPRRLFFSEIAYLWPISQSHGKLSFPPSIERESENQPKLYESRFFASMPPNKTTLSVRQVPQKDQTSEPNGSERFLTARFGSVPNGSEPNGSKRFRTVRFGSEPFGTEFHKHDETSM
jgi:hypothetical protein